MNASSASGKPNGNIKHRKGKRHIQQEMREKRSFPLQGCRSMCTLLAYTSNKEAKVMMVNAKEVRAHFAEYIARAEQGEEIVITRNGQVVARLVPPKQHAVLDPDDLAARRNHRQTPMDIPNLVLMARQEERY